MANGYSFESTEREISNEYQHNRVLMIFKRVVSGSIFFDSDLWNILHFMAIETYIPLTAQQQQQQQCNILCCKETIQFWGSSPHETIQQDKVSQIIENLRYFLGIPFPLAFL